MDYHKINSHIILLLVVILVGLGVATLGREIALEAGRNIGTANLIFLIILIVCAIAYLVIMATLAHIIIPYIMKKLPNKRKSAPVVTENSVEIPKQSAEDIRQNHTKIYIEKQNEKINLFLEYSHLTMTPYMTDDELLRLDEYIRCYAIGESLPQNLTPIKPLKLKKHDIFHFGWNMAHYFGHKKQDVVSWLQAVFIDLQELEFSYIKGKLHDSQSEKFTIPNIDNIPNYLAKQHK